MTHLLSKLGYTTGLVVTCGLLTTGCSLKTMAARTVANTLADGGDTFTRDDDPELVRDAVPFALKTYESLLETVPDHRGLLLATCKGFTQYAYAFVQADADAIEGSDYARAEALRQRALNLYIRGRGYCLRGLEARLPGVALRLMAEPGTALARAKGDDVALLYWTGASWGAAISLGLDRPALVADLPAVRALIDRARALEEGFGEGALDEALVTLEGLPPAMGGSPERARRHFQRALELSGGKRPSVFVTLAMAVSLPAQDRAEFERLLEQALAVSPDADPSNRLATLVAHQRARTLRDRLDALFPPAEPEGSKP